MPLRQQHHFMKSGRQNKEQLNKLEAAPFFQKEEPTPATPFFTNTSPLLQQPANAPKDAANQDMSGVLTPATAALPTFDFSEKSQSFGRFDARYTPVGPAPAEGKLDITLKVHITYEDFSAQRKRKDPYKNLKFTKEQLSDFNWTPAEKIKFAADFISSVQSGWSSKFKFRLKDPAFAEYVTAVNVKVQEVDKPELANTKINALKIPKDAPRFRSFVHGNQATLEKRDPSEPKKNTVGTYEKVKQIGPFGFDSSTLTPDIISQITELASFMKSDPKPESWSLGFNGRASSQGSKDYNAKLAQRRSDAVRFELNRQMGWGDEANYIGFLSGEDNATAEAKFRRVDVTVSKSSSGAKDVDHNVAAHEAGHMFGLGDEYVRESNLMDDETPKFLGDKPSHYDLVEKYMGKDEAEQLLIVNNESIMSEGNTVMKGHYVTFLLALNKLTNYDAEHKNWRID